MVFSKHPEVIEGRRRLISTDVIDPEESSEDGSIDDDGADSDEEDESGSGDADVSTGVTESRTEEVGEFQQAVKNLLFHTIC